jgi:hypothetical protein
MSYRLRMSAEIGDWLAELSSSEPVTAAEVGAALVAAMSAGELSGLPLVGDITARPAADPADPRAMVDYAYQGLLEELQHMRKARDDAAGAVQDAERQLSQLGSEPGVDPGMLAQLRQRLDDASRELDAATARSQRIQRDVDAFRARKETAKAMYTAAHASLRIRAAVEAAAGMADQVGGNGAVAGDGSPPAGGDELAKLNQAIAAAEADLQALAARAARTLRKTSGQSGPDAGEPAEDAHQPPSAGPAIGLLELRADPLGADIRIVAAVEPADTVTLLAVLDGEDAVAEHRDEAIELAGDLLTDIRAGAWPLRDGRRAADVEIAFAEPAAFLGKFFPDNGSVVTDRAAALAAARSLAELRDSRGVTRAVLAGKAGISEQRLRVIEESGLRVAEVHEAVACFRALGGRVELTADLDDSGPVTLY